jgi:putative pyruvate formate lyase activating enzyme
MNSHKDGIERVSKKLSALLGACRLCPRACGVNRLAGERGYCGAGKELEVAYIGPHHGEEPPISGTLGSGTIFLKHCTMRCVFCQNWQISAAAPGNGRDNALPLDKIKNCHNINLVSPTQYLPQILDAIRDIDLPIVYNTNGYDSVEVLRLLDGIVDTYLPDIKYSDNALAKKYSDTPDYVEYNQKAIAEMFRQAGPKKLIVRHLVLPGLIENSKDCLDFIARLSPDITVSIMCQYSPQYQADRFPEINRKLTSEEYATVVEYAENLGLENCFVQEMTSQDVFVPDFEKQNPFN